MGGTPVNTSAGKVRKLPPPAMALSTPAANAAAASKGEAARKSMRRLFRAARARLPSGRQNLSRASALRSAMPEPRTRRNWLCQAAPRCPLEGVARSAAGGLPLSCPAKLVLQPVQHLTHRLRRTTRTGGQFLLGQRQVEPHEGAVQRVARGEQLLRDLGAVGALFQQLLQPAHLALGPAQAVHQLGLALAGQRLGAGGGSGVVAHGGWRSVAQADAGMMLATGSGASSEPSRRPRTVAKLSQSTIMVVDASSNTPAGCSSARRRVSVVKAANGKDSAQNGTPKGWPAMRRTTGSSHNTKNSATPQRACTAATGACIWISTRPITAGGAMVMNQAGKTRSGSGLWAKRRASTRVSTTGQKNTPMPICAADQPSIPSGRPASGASTLPTTGISSTGVTDGHSPVLPGPWPGWAAAAGEIQRLSTHSVAQSWVRLPAHQSTRPSGARPPSAPPSATPTVASSSSDTGNAATKAWRTGCLRSSARAAGGREMRSSEATSNTRNTSSA